MIILTGGGHGMGSGNVRIAFARWGMLDAVPFRGLCYMSLVSMDNAAPPLFWQGWEALGWSLGRDIPDDLPGNIKNAAAEAIRKERKAHYRAVQRVTETLHKAGAIVLDTPSAPGRHAVWALQLDLRRVTVSVTYGCRSAYATGDADRHPSWGGKGGETLTQTEHKPKPISPLVSSSPATLDEIEAEEYRVAYLKLSTLPDLGESLLEQIDTTMPPRQRIITAAANMREAL